MKVALSHFVQLSANYDRSCTCMADHYVLPVFLLSFVFERRPRSLPNSATCSKVSEILKMDVKNVGVHSAKTRARKLLVFRLFNDDISRLKRAYFRNQKATYGKQIINYELRSPAPRCYICLVSTAGVKMKKSCPEFSTPVALVSKRKSKTSIGSSDNWLVISKFGVVLVHSTLRIISATKSPPPLKRAGKIG